MSPPDYEEIHVAGSPGELIDSAPAVPAYARELLEERLAAQDSAAEAPDAPEQEREPPGDAPAPEAPDTLEEVKLPLTEHLEELRGRIIKSLIAWTIGCCLTYFLLPQLLSLATGLLHHPLIFTRPTEAFMVYLKIALTGGFFVSLPFVLHQVLAFVVPGLLPKEKFWILRLVPVATLLFLAGALFAYHAVLPVTLRFFMSFQTQSLVPMISIGEYLSFFITMIILCGLVFETPLVLLFLSLVGIVNSRALAVNRKYALFLIIIVAAVVTPTPDAFTQLVVAVPMYLLYELSIILIRLLKR